jgi:hypothetical protein
VRAFVRLSATLRRFVSCTTLVSSYPSLFSFIVPGLSPAIMHLSYLLASIIAIATATPQSTLPTTEKSVNFRITASTGNLDHPLSFIQGWNLSFSGHRECYLQAAFYSNGRATVFYVNGTDDEFTNRQATLQTDNGGPPPRSHGVHISQTPDEEGRLPVYLSCGPGSRGLQVADWPGTVYYQTGTMYACNTTTPDDTILGLFWHEHGKPTPKECVGLELQAWCLNVEGAWKHEFGRNSTCYR